MPAAPADAKGLLMSALAAEAPVLCLEHRWLYDRSGLVPAEPYQTPIGKAAIVREGADVTVAAVSHMVWEAIEAADALATEGVAVEVIDLRSVRPLDSDSVCRSVAKTGRLVVADTGWRSFGLSAELAARAGEACFGRLRAPIGRVALPETPTPCSPALERAYYPGPAAIADAVRATLEGARRAERPGEPPTGARRGAEFSGPF
jgi:pyruvate dehydrogenase E1 component beta subunit